MPPKDAAKQSAKSGSDGSRITKAAAEPKNASENPMKARKRAMDREAQRHFREKTKNYIAHLEQTVRACEANTESERVAQLLAENGELYSTVERIRRIMSDIFNAVQPEIPPQQRNRSQENANAPQPDADPGTPPLNVRTNQEVSTVGAVNEPQTHVIPTEEVHPAGQIPSGGSIAQADIQDSAHIAPLGQGPPPPEVVPIEELHPHDDPAALPYSFTTTQPCVSAGVASHMPWKVFPQASSTIDLDGLFLDGMPAGNISSMLAQDMSFAYAAGVYGDGNFDIQHYLPDGTVAERPISENNAHTGHPGLTEHDLMAMNDQYNNLQNGQYDALQALGSSSRLVRNAVALNFWLQTNTIYNRIFEISSHQADVARRSDRNVVFKAIKCGWGTLALEHQNNPVIQILRSYDDMVFDILNPVNRLAIAYKNYLLIQYFLNRDEETLNSIPAWQRPSQFYRVEKRPILVDFLAWPALREKLMNGSLPNESSEFGQSYLSNFRFAWPFSIDDTYRYYPATDTYEATPLFERYHNDLRFWTMEQGFFSRFPELAPLMNGSPSSSDSPRSSVVSSRDEHTMQLA